MINASFDRRLLLRSLALAGGASAVPAWAKSNKRDISQSWPAVQAVLDAWVRDKKVAGAAAAIARGLDPVEFMVSGALGFDNPALVTPDTLFRIYSQTKPVTGLAAMLLIEDGKLKMHQNIADLIPAFANPKVLTEPDKSLAARPATAPITVRHLLTHTAGLGYSIVTKGPLLEAYQKLGITPAIASKTPLPGLQGTATAPSLEEFANRLGSLPLVDDPGRRWSYSVSLDLLGRVIEVASGMPFDAFLDQRFFKPLGMTSTFFQVPGSEAARLTSNYIKFGTNTVPIDPGKDSIYSVKPAFPFGGAGLVSTPRDFDRFLLMLMGEGAIGQTRVMKAETARWGMSNLVHPDTRMESYVKGQGFGAGGRVTLSSVNGEGVGTFGWAGAAGTIGWVDRTKATRGSAWIQLMGAEGQTFAGDVAKAIYSA